MKNLKMRKRIMLCALLVTALVFSAVSAFAETKRVILDSDMRPGFDDGAVLVMLAGWNRIGNGKTPDQYAADHPGYNKIELLGVTVVAGNEAEPRGFAHGVRQLEIISAKDIAVPGTSVPSGIPIYEGARNGLRRERFSREGMAVEQQITGGAAPAYARWYADKGTGAGWDGVAERDPMQSWINFYKSTLEGTGEGYGQYGRTAPEYPYAFYPAQPDGTPGSADPNGIDNAVDFIIHTINSNPPHTISVLVIGPVTNIALALRKDPGIAERVKEIVYMGGSFYMKGNNTAAAETNWRIDPEAAKMAVRTPWGDRNSDTFKSYGNQIISGLEAAMLLKFLPTNGDPVNNPTAEEKRWLEQSQFFYDELVEQCRFYRSLPTAGSAYDVIAASWLVDPAVIPYWYKVRRQNPVPVPDADETNVSTVPWGIWIDVESDYNANYGRSSAYPALANDDTAVMQGPLGTQKAAIQYLTDEVKFWNEIVAPALVDPNKTTPTPYVK